MAVLHAPRRGRALDPDDDLDRSWWYSHQAADIANVSYRQLDYWVRCGALEVSRHAAGSGTQRRWSRSDVARLDVFGRLMVATGDVGLVGEAVRLAWADEPEPARVVIELAGLDVTITADVRYP